MESIKDRVEQNRLTLENEIIEAQLAQVRRSKRMQEAGELLWTPRYDADEPWQARDPFPRSGTTSSLEDRLDGDYAPVYETEDELAIIRYDGRLITAENEAGIGSRDALTNYTLGTGFVYNVSPRIDGEDQALADYVESWLDEFDERVAWYAAEREIHERATADGEVFIQIEHVGGGMGDILYREPEAITEPNDARGMDDYVGQYQMSWSYGIASPLGRPNRPIGYFVDFTGDQRDWEYVDTDHMVHIKRNVTSNAKRGVSDYYPVSSELRRADKILRNTGEGAALQSAIAWIREHPPGTTGTQVLSLGTSRTELEVDRVTPSGNTRTTRYQRYLPGTILDVKAGQLYKPGPMGTGAVYVDVSDAIIRYVGIRWNMPEYMISGSGQNQNFASTLVSESPFVRAIEARQRSFKGYFSQLKWKVLGLAVRAGVFNRFGVVDLFDLKQRITINVQCPRVSVRNKLEETQVNAILHQYRIISTQTWSAREDLDFEHEQAKLEEFPPVDNLGEVGTVMGNVGVGNKPQNKEHQPQANEPGNRRVMGRRESLELARKLMWGEYP